MKKSMKTITYCIIMVIVINMLSLNLVEATTTQASTLTVTVSPGTSIDSTKADITESATSKFVVNITDGEVTIPNTSDFAPTTGTNLIDGYILGADVTTGAAVGAYIQVYDVDSNGKTAGFYQKQLTIDNIKKDAITYWKDNVGDITDLTGAGTQANPYKISSAEELTFMAKMINDGNDIYDEAYYELTQDIDLSAHQWTPIGDNYTNYFKGNFNGKGHEISHVIIGTKDSPDNENNYVGLFGWFEGTVDNLGVSVSIFSSKDSYALYIGGLVANNGGIIRNSYATGNVTSEKFSNIGGLAGYSGGLIINCYTTVDVRGGANAYVGGLVGYYYMEGTLSNSYATGDVTGGASAYVGGLVGNGIGTTTNSYYNADAVQTLNGSLQDLKGRGYGEDTGTAKTSAYMQSQDFVDELNTNRTGHDDWSTWVAEKNDYPTLGTVLPSTPASALTVTVSPGTLVGSTKVDIIDIATSRFVVNITDSEVPTPNISDAAPIIGVNLIDGYISKADVTTGAAVGVYLQVYDVDTNGNVAKFYQKQLTTNDIKQFTLTYWKDNIGDVKELTGLGTEASPYQISSPEELSFMAKMVSRGETAYNAAYYELTQDLDLAEHQWTPIGDDFKEFNGHFNGDNHEIKNVLIGTKDIPNSTYNNAGLFFNTGSDSIIENLGVSVSIYSSSKYKLGGLVGNSDGKINNCYSMGDIIGSSAEYIGGLVGYNSQGKIKNSHAIGNITGEGDRTNVGGLVGYCNNMGVISNSYAIGDITGGSNANVGGLIGNSIGTISNSYASGNVTGGSKSNVGGIAGQNFGGISYSYYNSDASQIVDGTSQSAKKDVGFGNGGAFGIPELQMKSSSVEGALVGTLNGNIGSNTDWYSWQQDRDVNSGYPTHVVPIIVKVPTVETISKVTTSGATSVTVSGNVTDNGNGTLSDVGIVYGTTINPEINVGKTTKVAAATTTLGEFSVDLTGLTVGETYHVRAYATNEEGTSYGEDVEFKTAGRYKVTFDSNGGSDVNSVTVDYGSIISKPTEPIKAGCNFGGWYKEEDLKNMWDFDSDTISAQITLYAKWNIKTFTINFKDYDGTIIKTETVNYGSSAATPKNPSRSGYSFTGWDKDFSNITSDLNVTATYSNNSSSHKSTGGTSPTNQTEATVIVNGKKQTAGTETVKVENGQKTVEVKADSEVISQKIDEALKEKQADSNAGKNTIEIPVAAKDAKNITGILTGDIIRKMADNEFTLAVNTDNVDYIIPAKEVEIEKVASTLGVTPESLKDIEVSVEIQNTNENIVNEMIAKAKASGYDIVFPPVEFKLVAKIKSSTSNETKEVTISKFSSYVQRVMEIPVGVDPSKITTGIVYNSDGTFSHIPTSVFEKNGKWYANLNSLTNSNYSVIWNPIKVVSVENHWSKTAVTDMASRLVIDNPTTFMPDLNITRGEFAEYITKALGLYRTGVAKTRRFTDVEIANKLADAIEIATDYGIINGYPDGTFGPEAQITREEAMVMYSRAMEIVGLKEKDNARIDNYKDKEDVADWAYDDVKKTVSVGVFNGKTNETLNPKDTFTYAEAATAIRNLLIESDLINK